MILPNRRRSFMRRINEYSQPYSGSETSREDAQRRCSIKNVKSEVKISWGINKTGDRN